MKETERPPGMSDAAWELWQVMHPCLEANQLETTRIVRRWSAFGMASMAVAADALLSAYAAKAAAAKRACR